MRKRIIMAKEKEIEKINTGKTVIKKPALKSVKSGLSKNVASKSVSEKKKRPVKTGSPLNASVKAAEKTAIKTGPYTEAVGRRKTAVARIRVYNDGKKSFIVNNKPSDKYFHSKELERIIRLPFDIIQEENGLSVTAIVKGGGIHAQAEAICHGISRSLLIINAEHRKKLRGAGLLTRDARIRERKKFGLRRARRAPQFSKR